MSRGHSSTRLPAVPGIRTSRRCDAGARLPDILIAATSMRPGLSTATRRYPTLRAYVPGARYDGDFAAAASTSSGVISGVRLTLTFPLALIISDSAVALASSGNSQIP